MLCKPIPREAIGDVTAADSLVHYPRRHHDSLLPICLCKSLASPPLYSFSLSTSAVLFLRREVTKTSKVIGEGKYHHIRSSYGADACARVASIQSVARPLQHWFYFLEQGGESLRHCGSRLREVVRERELCRY